MTPNVMMLHLAKFLRENGVPLSFVIDGIRGKDLKGIIEKKNFIEYDGCIDYLFLWSGTIQGHAYWYKIDVKWRVYCRHNNIKHRINQ